MSTLRDEVVSEFERLEEDLLYTEKAYFAAAEQFQALHYILGGAAAVASAATAVSAIGDKSALAAGLSIAAAIAAAVVTFVKPQASAERHVEAGRRLGDLRFRIRQARLLDTHAESRLTDHELRELARAFTAEKQSLLSDAPATSERAFRRAKRKIEGGHFEYEVGRSSTGTEPDA